MEIPVELIGALASVIVGLLSIFLTSEYWKRRITKLEYFKNRFGPFYHVCVDTLDSLKFIHKWLEGSIKWDPLTVWEYLFRFHSYQWTLWADHLPDLNYLVSKKWLDENEKNKLKEVCETHFDIPFHQLLSKQKQFPEQGPIRVEELRFGNVYIRQIRRPDLPDKEKVRAINKLKNKLKPHTKEFANAIDILETNIIDDLLAKKI